MPKRPQSKELTPAEANHIVRSCQLLFVYEKIKTKTELRYDRMRSDIEEANVLDFAQRTAARVDELSSEARGDTRKGLKGWSTVGFPIKKHLGHMKRWRDEEGSKATATIATPDAVVQINHGDALPASMGDIQLEGENTVQEEEDQVDQGKAEAADTASKENTLPALDVWFRDYIAQREISGKPFRQMKNQARWLEYVEQVEKYGKPPKRSKGKGKGKVE